VSRTVTDLAGSNDIKVEHLEEAIHYRSLDREGWPDEGCELSIVNGLVSAP